MTPLPPAGRLLGQLCGDAAAEAILSDEAFVARMVAVEATLARACGAVGLVPADRASRVADALARARPDIADLAAGTAADGVPVPALLRALRPALGPDGDALHVGATSQDIVDCARTLQWRDLLALLEDRLAGLLDLLQAASAAQAGTVMAGRTRSQIATPIGFGLRIATWAQPLIAQEQDLPALRRRLLRVQFGGAAGTSSVAGPQAAALSAALAADLGLDDAPCWHTDRSGQLALAGWLAGVTAGLSRLARDLILMGRSEAGEARAGAGGGSSAMPQKSNPVAAEAIVALADLTACLLPAMARAAAPQEERDGAAWTLEWLALPQMGLACAAALRHATALIDSLQPAPARMAAALDHDHGAALAEAAAVALAAHMPRDTAQTVLREALAQARAGGLALPQALARHPAAGGLEDWPRLLDPRAVLPASAAMAARIFARRGAADGGTGAAGGS